MSVRLMVSKEALALLYFLQADADCRGGESFSATKFAGTSRDARDELMRAGYLRRTKFGYRLTRNDVPLSKARRAAA